MFYIISGLLSLCATAHAFSSGAPSGKCDDMIPKHGVSPQSSTAPYNIILSAEKYTCPNEDITVTINGTSPFKGFFCQPRETTNLYSTVGTLSAAPGGVATSNPCGTNASLTHTESSDKSSITLVWTTPSTQNNVYIVCTLVQTKETFWARLSSNVIRFQTGGNCGGTDTGNGDKNSAPSKHKSIFSFSRMLSLFLFMYLNSKRS